MRCARSNEKKLATVRTNAYNTPNATLRFNANFFFLMHQEAGFEVLPAEDRALPHWTVPALDESPPNRPVLVVQVPHADEGSPPKGVPEVEGPAEGPLEGGVEGDGEEEVAVEGS